MGLPSAHRMTQPVEFAAVRTQGRAKSGRLLTVAYLAQPEVTLLRLGFTITKRIGNAVKRNLLRRRLREITRETHPRLLGQGMLVTIPRPVAVKASFAELRAEWHYLVGKLQLLPRPAPVPPPVLVASPLPELL
jgi:ribonuclease P protein component